MSPTLVVVMGVAGVGKTSLARLLAEGLGYEFADADDFHSARNKQLMSAGKPLSDADRAPWMDAICRFLGSCRQSGQSIVLAHSALRRQHRERLRSVGFRTLMLHLTGDPATIATRVGSRCGHFMPADLVDSQFAAMQCPANEVDVVELDCCTPLPLLVERARWLACDRLRDTQP